MTSIRIGETYPLVSGDRSKKTHLSTENSKQLKGKKINNNDHIKSQEGTKVVRPNMTNQGIREKKHQLIYQNRKSRQVVVTNNKTKPEYYNRSPSITNSSYSRSIRSSKSNKSRKEVSAPKLKTSNSKSLKSRSHSRENQIRNGQHHHKTSSKELSNPLKKQKTVGKMAPIKEEEE